VQLFIRQLNAGAAVIVPHKVDAFVLFQLNSALGSMARELNIPVFTYSRADVYSVFRSMGFANKQMLAAVIARHIPAFERHVPPPRKAVDE
jgi:hypothetical protein